MRYFALILALIFSVTVHAQSRGSAKIYAYKQGSSHGAAPKTDEQGNVVHSNKQASYNYFIYLVSPSRVYPSEIWLNNQLYSASYKKVNSPVEFGNANLPISPKKQVLVPKTSSTVLHLTPTTETEGKHSFKFNEKLKANELVIIYKYKGKFYYSSLSQLPSMESAALQ